jgi:hypothetical protein
MTSGYLLATNVALLQPEFLLPAQVRTNAKPRRPEHLLMLAVLEDAIMVLQGTVAFEHPRHWVRERNATLTWVASNRRDWPFAFAAICDEFGFDIQAVRRRLGNLNPTIPRTRHRCLTVAVRSRLVAA